ncbi:hypothetical protein [Shewanella dokdonensis]|jgi:hypothetical protein|uniref:Uncharacterized protein n=1 Tax=Shewanella dokdonensis TaxID=712036 RepID=A0ABX8DBG8_9GAMM|nr:hypothetical protein [Shewanella dokdonensis]MCL1075503.1 hypothetical protein [Shewanella dokdonensis]QVK22178.1 hypothetical protein KHX94_12120 [Shewanella dokdonensis]
MTTYAAELLHYVICHLNIESRNLAERTAQAEAYLDANIGQDWRSRTATPVAGTCIIADTGEED